jgi:hypothetical protein
MTKPFELELLELRERVDEMVGETFADLTSQFLLLPRGSAYLDYEGFRDGYEALRIETNGFREFDVPHVWRALRRNARAMLAVRATLGVSPPEWRDMAAELGHIDFAISWARNIDRRIKEDANYFTSGAGRTALNVERTTRLLNAAVAAIVAGAPEAPEGLIHRLDKIDTSEGLTSLQHVAQNAVPYSVLLYERYLGRPYASHRDSISELVGDVMETAIEDQLAAARIPFRKTKRAERIPGFEQAPDFFAPDEIAPSVIIEAKITGDDGTARDKVSRILRLASMRDERERAGRPAFEVVACIDGRGFGVRDQDMRDMLIATRGKVFTAATLDQLVEHTSLKDLLPSGE